MLLPWFPVPLQSFFSIPGASWNMVIMREKKSDTLCKDLSGILMFQIAAQNSLLKEEGGSGSFGKCGTLTPPSDCHSSLSHLSEMCETHGWKTRASQWEDSKSNPNSALFAWLSPVGIASPRDKSTGLPQKCCCRSVKCGSCSHLWIAGASQLAPPPWYSWIRVRGHE